MTTPHTFSPVILREYDIRGEIGKNLSERDAYALGRAYGMYVHNKGGKTIAASYDGRTTSPGLFKELLRGLTETGLDVLDIGRGPTPMLWFAVKHKKTDAGIMVTGSHNPANFNGFKMTLQKQPVFGQEIQIIGNIAANGDYYQTEKSGTVTQISIQSDYITRLMQDYTGSSPLTIIWDNGNGAAGDALRDFVALLPGKHILLYDDIDGNFPNHHPDPTVDKNLIDLQKTVKDNNADLGIAFDGDGDRIGIIDENSDIIRCDILMALYAADVLKTNPGAAIIGDVKCGQAMFDEIARLGGQPVMSKTGHSLVKSKMAEMNSPLGGELSGHIFFADKYYGFDDALYCAVRLINLVSAAKERGGTLSGLTAHLPKLHSTPEIRVDVPEDEKFKIVPRIIASLKNQKHVEISDIDGIRVKNKDGWWLIRASNTQSVLSARAEASSLEGLERLKSMAVEEMAKLGYSFSFDS